MHNKSLYIPMAFCAACVLIMSTVTSIHAQTSPASLQTATNKSLKNSQRIKDALKNVPPSDPSLPSILNREVLPIPEARPLILAARKLTQNKVRYDGSYRSITYPNGDVPSTIGVCSDVVIRAYRAAYEFDLQRAVHEDMKDNFALYPDIWGLSRTDKNIDHRRVPNLETYFGRMGTERPATQSASDYLPGDIVSWRIGGSLPHIGIVSERISPNGTPLIIHNVGVGPKEENVLFTYKLHKHYRFIPTL